MIALTLLLATTVFASSSSDDDVSISLADGRLVTFKNQSPSRGDLLQAFLLQTDATNIRFNRNELATDANERDLTNLEAKVTTNTDNLAKTEAGVAQLFDAFGPATGGNGVTLPTFGMPKEYTFPTVELANADETPALAGFDHGSTRGFANVAVRASWVEVDIQLRGGLTFVATPGLRTVTNAHFHRGAVNNNGGVIVNLLTVHSIVTNAGARLIAHIKFADVALGGCPAGQDKEECLLSALFSGMVYINLHTAANGGGELRGQIVPEGLRPVLALGANEVPPVQVARAASWVASVNDVVVDTAMGGERAAAVLQFSIDFLGYKLNNVGGGDRDVTRVHIHDGRTGVNGGVVVALVEMGQVEATVQGATIDPIVNGVRLQGTVPINTNVFAAKGLYLNIHTAENPAGELRAQIFDDGAIIRA